MLLFNISSFHSILEVYITILKIQHADVMCCKGAPYSGLRLFFSSPIFYNTLRLLYISQPVLLYIFILQANKHLEVFCFTCSCVWLPILLYLNVHMHCVPIAVLTFVNKRKV